MTTLTHVYVPLVKAEKQADGTMLVSGPITSSALDRDLQVCDPDWLNTAVPKWFGEGGNVREMHSNIAAGKALTYEKQDDGKHWIEALVVDPSSVAKVEHGVLTGFSIGIKGARVVKSSVAPNGAIVDGAIIETSLVDRPANPECLLTIAKSDSAGLIAPVEEQVFVDLTADRPLGTVVPDASPVLEASAEVRARAADVLDALHTLYPTSFVKAEGDEADDITTAGQAVAIIARLIESEARSLATGDMSEAADIEVLLDAVRALRWFMLFEAEEEKADTPDTAPDPDPVEVKADEPDTPPASSTPAPAPVIVEDVSKTEDSLLGKVETALMERFTALVTESLAKAEDAHKAEMESLRAELAKVKDLPVPGGPVRVRVKSDAVQADDVDRQALLAEAARYDAAAETSTDRTVAKGYRDLAETKRAAALR